jgi:hypothetical protein
MNYDKVLQGEGINQGFGQKAGYPMEETFHGVSCSKEIRK